MHELTPRSVIAMGRPRGYYLADIKITPADNGFIVSGIPQYEFDSPLDASLMMHDQSEVVRKRSTGIFVELTPRDVANRVESILNDYVKSQANHSEK